MKCKKYPCLIVWKNGTVNMTKGNREDTMGELEKLPNIGKTLADQLEQVGISTVDDLKSTGSEQAWLRIQQIDESACINRLYALEGAIQGIKKTLLADDRKSELKDFYNWHKK